ncbi:MAG: hypothetical protein ACTTJV_02930 [Ottowia sp.]
MQRSIHGCCGRSACFFIKILLLNVMALMRMTGKPHSPCAGKNTYQIFRAKTSMPYSHATKAGRKLIANPALEFESKILMKIPPTEANSIKSRNPRKNRKARQIIEPRANQT